MRVAITTWRRPLPTSAEHTEDLYTLAAGYARAVADHGETPLLLPYLDPSRAGEALDACEALILGEGGDMEPATYGARDTGATRGVSRAADAGEVALARGARERGIPVLGICRGMQVLNVACGGTLVRDVTVEGGGHGPGSREPGAPRIAVHPVTIEGSSRLAAVYGTLAREVASIDHAVVEEVARGFRVTARAPDGVVEGLEQPGEWLAMGVQWRPDFSEDADGPLFSTFLRWVREFREEGRG